MQASIITDSFFKRNQPNQGELPFIIFERLVEPQKAKPGGDPRTEKIYTNKFDPTIHTII